MKKPKLRAESPAPVGLQGVGLRVQTDVTGPPKVQRADEHIKHSLFCEPAECEQQLSDRSPPRRRRAVRRSIGASSSKAASPNQSSAIEHSPDDDKLAPLPIKIVDRKDSMSPLQSNPWDEKSIVSGSPTLVRANSGAIARGERSPAYVSPMRSMFPRYDPALPLSQQQYYPADESPISLPREQGSKIANPIQEDEKKTKPAAERPSAPIHGNANSDELVDLWDAANGNITRSTRTAKLSLQRNTLAPLSPGRKSKSSPTVLSLGRSSEAPLYSIERVDSPSSSREPTPPKELLVRRYRPDAPASLPVAQIALQDLSADSASNGSPAQTRSISIFPQMAALHAIEAVVNSPAACEIARFDPLASSPQAARLAQSAVAEAEGKYRCELVHVEAQRYELRHPSLGSLVVRIKDGNVVMHQKHPVTGGIDKRRAELGAVDLRHESCTINTPALLVLDTPHIIDTVVCALLTVATILVDHHGPAFAAFDGPPPTPLPKGSSAGRGSRQSQPKKKWYQRSSKVKSKDTFEFSNGEVVELPVLTRGVLGLLGFSLKTIVWLLGTGVKVLASLVVGISHLATKA